jgi:hypothetical protein
MAEAKMIGYWVGTNPVKTDNPEVRATVYAKSGKAMISLASWAPGPMFAELRVDWKALGLDPAKVRLRAPEIPGIQLPATFKVGERIPFEPGKGWILIVE